MKHREGYSQPPKIFPYEYYQRHYELEERHWWSFGMRAIAGGMLHRHLQGPHKLSVLDTGCGAGGTLSWMRPYADPHRLVGVDFSWHALEFCQKRQLKQLAQVFLPVLPFSNESFDLVFCLDALQHLRRQGSDGQGLREFLRVLKPGGSLYLRTTVRREAKDRRGKPPRLGGLADT